MLGIELLGPLKIEMKHFVLCVHCLSFKTCCFYRGTSSRVEKGREAANIMTETVKKKKATPLVSPDAEEPLPPGWSAHQSRSNPGLLYYFNCRTGATTWNRSEVTAATVEVLNNEPSGSIPVKKLAEVVRGENLEESVNKNTTSNRGVEGDQKIAHLEELLRRERKEVEVKSGASAPCAPSTSVGIGLSSGLRSRKKGEIGIMRGGLLGNRSVAPVKGLAEELLAEKQQDLEESVSVACNNVKQRTKITFSEEKKVKNEVQQPETNNRCSDAVQDDNSLTNKSQQRNENESEGDNEGDLSSDEELYGMDEEEAAKLRSLKSKFVEEEPDQPSAQECDKGGGEEVDVEESNDRPSSGSNSSPERAGTRKRRAGEQLRLIEAMEQTLREKYGYTDDTYGQRYIKKDVEEKKRL